MTLEDLKEYLVEWGHEDTIVFDSPDYADAFIGVTWDERAVYDYNKMVECLVRNDGMDELEAMEFIDYNAVRSLPYVENGPIIIYPFCGAIREWEESEEPMPTTCAECKREVEGDAPNV